jgi:aspartyl-tRNA(Asn)/glutamyl-tRNA(Gln) amidotransferase subunit A
VNTLVDVDASCRARVEQALATIEQVQQRCNAFTSLRVDDALVEADAIDRRSASRRLLEGVPVVVKDLFDVAGLPTTGGCAAYRDRVATADSAVAAALRAAGAIVVAKTNQHELGAGATGLVSCFGPTANPFDSGRIAGGSSSGSAVAVAAGAVPLAIGSDTGGSIRMPASFCGITGLRPTPGRVSLAGALAMSPGYDTAGPMAATARECSIALAALTGEPTAPAITAEALRTTRIGLPSAYFQLVHPDTRDAVEKAATAFEGLGARVEWVDGPDLDPHFDGFRHVWADLAHHHRRLWDNPEVSDDVAALIETGRCMTGVDYARSRAHADRVRLQFADVLGSVDVLLAPATPYPAPRADQQEVAVAGGTVDVHRGGPSRLTVPVNEARLPAVSFPVGITGDHLPLGAQLIGPPQSDESLLAIVAAFQDARPQRAATRREPGRG